MLVVLLFCAASHLIFIALPQTNMGNKWKKISLNERGCREKKGNKGLPTTDRYSFINPSLHICFFDVYLLFVDKDIYFKHN